MAWNMQPQLENKELLLEPLQESDFDELFQVASDPEIWAMHPNKDRYQIDKFKVFFDGAIASHGAFKIIRKDTHKIIGSTRFYDQDEENLTVFIGYTFYEKIQWGKGFNQAVKKMMLDYASQYAKRVFFHVGAQNIRSVKAMQKLGAQYVKEEEIAYFGEPNRLNILFKIELENFSPISG